jgi:hypothetical protein
MLNRGVTLPGLCGGAFLRASCSENQDVNFQIFRMAGWKAGYYDLVRVYCQDRQVMLLFRLCQILVSMNC